MEKLPPIGPRKPSNETAPELPKGASINVVVSLGFLFESVPISVAHVSAAATETPERYPI